MAFRLPFAQQEALGLMGCSTLALQAVSSGFPAPCWCLWHQRLHTVRQEKTLAFAWVLQCCTERFGVLTRVLWNMAWELQKYMAPLLSLSGDDIVKALLLKPTDEELRTPHPRGGSHPPREGTWAARSPRGCCSPPRMSRNSWNHGNHQAPLLLHPLHCNPAATLPRKKSQQGIEADPSLTSNWIWSYVENNERVPNWWRELQSILCSQDEPFNDIQVKELTCWQAAAFRLPSTQLEKAGWWNALPCLGVLVRKDFLPLTEFQGM